jgi:hypothetical protein
MDPFTIAALGLGTAGSLGGAIYNAATAKDRKRKFLEEQQRIAQKTARGHTVDFAKSLTAPAPRGADFWDSSYGPIDAKERQNEVDKYAEENFDVNPMDFVPFVQNATQLAGGLYDAGLSKPPDPSRLPDAGGFQLDDPGTLEYYNPEQAGLDAKAPWDELEYYDPRQSQRWWQR